MFRGYDAKLDRKVAIKVMHRHLAEQAGRRMAREARALAKLSHPDAVHVYEVGTHHDAPFIAHDLAPGASTVLGKKEEHRLLLHALRRIPVKHQVALELYYIEGMRGPELAEALDVPEATARSRLRRGLAQVKKEIERLASKPSLAASTVGGLESWAAELGGQVRAAPS